MPVAQQGTNQANSVRWELTMRPGHVIVLRVLNPASSKNPRFVIRPEYRDACQARLIPLEDNDFSVARLDHHPYRIAHPQMRQLPPLDHIVNGRRAHPQRLRDFLDAHQIHLSSET